jgi:hypothetical protein
VEIPKFGAGDIKPAMGIAMGNGPFIDGLPIKNGDVPWLC